MDRQSDILLKTNKISRFRNIGKVYQYGDEIEKDINPVTTEFSYVRLIGDKIHPGKGIDIKGNRADARKAEADGEATYIEKTGTAQGAQVKAIGLARAEAFERQVSALGQIPTAIVNSITALAENGVKIIPDTLVMGGGNALDGTLASLMGFLKTQQPGATLVPEKRTRADKPEK